MKETVWLLFPSLIKWSSLALALILPPAPILFLLSMLSQRRAANTLALIVLNFFTFWFCFTLLFPRKTWKSYYTSVESLSEIPTCPKGNWHPNLCDYLQEQSYCFKRERKGRMELQLCSACNTSFVHTRTGLLCSNDILCNRIWVKEC